MSTDVDAAGPQLDVHAGVAAQADAYAELARRYAERGRIRQAVLATWFADVCVLQCLLWESGLDQAPDPTAQLNAVGEAVARSLASLTETATSGSAVELVQAARNLMTAPFDAPARDLLRERFPPVGHLEADGVVPAPTDDEDRLHGRTPEQLVRELHVTAADCLAVARAMLRADLAEDAMDQARMAHLAVFEGFLVEAAVAAGDTTLTTVSLRWDLAVSVLEQTQGVASTESLRALLLNAVGPAERTALAARLEPLDLAA